MIDSSCYNESNSLLTKCYRPRTALLVVVFLVITRFQVTYATTRIQVILNRTTGSWVYISRYYADETATLIS